MSTFVQFYVDTVKLMAQQQFLPGTPLRTLCLILAGQPAEVFSTSSSAAFSNSHSSNAIGLQQSDQVCAFFREKDHVRDYLKIIVSHSCGFKSKKSDIWHNLLSGFSVTTNCP